MRVRMTGTELTKKELKDILDTVLREIDDDPDDGPRLRAAAAPLRLEVRNDSKGWRSAA